jgi:hypothetical protein
MKYLSAAETAVLVRAELKAAFPGVKFSVKTHTYAGGASIDVRYDGHAGYEPLASCYCPGGPTVKYSNHCAKCGYTGRLIALYKPGMPSEAAVRDVVGMFHGRGFDGMIDMAYPIESYVKGGKVVGSKSPGAYGSVPAWDDKPEGAEVVHFGADHIFVEARA